MEGVSPGAEAAEEGSRWAQGFGTHRAGPVGRQQVGEVERGAVEDFQVPEWRRAPR